MSANDMTKPINVLFLCTGNSARSILSEALLNDLGQGKFIGWSAGSKPSGHPHPEGLAELQRHGHRTDLYRSKKWDEFAGDNAPDMDIIVTVCDNAAGEVCPIWPGHPLTVHWPASDPAHVEPLAARQRAFAGVYELCKARIQTLIALSPEDRADKAALQSIAKITA